MKILELIFLQDYKGFKKNTKVNFNDNEVNLILGVNGSGKTVLLESIVNIFYLTYLIYLEKLIHRTFEFDFECQIKYKIDEKTFEIKSENKSITICENESLIYQFKRDDVVKEYKPDRFFPEIIIFIASSMNDKINNYVYTFEIVRRLLELVQGFDNKSNKLGWTEKIRFMCINNQSAKMINQTYIYYKPNAVDNDLLDDLFKKVSSVKTDDPYDNDELSEIDKYTYFLKLWVKFTSSLKTKKYDKNGDYIRFYNDILSFKNIKLERKLPLFNPYDQNTPSNLLSSGEYDYLRFFLLLDIVNQRQNCLILSDEIDAHFNPRWSKNFLFNVYYFINKKNQIIHTSNSPFIISDEKNENIIYLLDHNCEKIMFNTFGANPNLINNSIFGVQGTISKRAQQEMEKVGNLIKENKNVEAFEKLNNLGESPEKSILKYSIEGKL